MDTPKTDGHALVARALCRAVLPHKLPISPRGGTLGHCQVFETHDRMVHLESTLLDEMAGLMGGRVAEEMVFGEGPPGRPATWKGSATSPTG